MSFVSILKKIGSIAISVEHVVAPIAETLLPAFGTTIAAIDGIFQRLQATIATVEVSNPAAGQGVVKAQAVVADFEAGLSFTQDILALEGKKLVWDDTQLQAAISAQVAAYNAMAALKASFKVVPVAPVVP